MKKALKNEVKARVALLKAQIAYTKKQTKLLS